MDISGRGFELPTNSSQVSKRASQFCVIPIFEYFWWNANFRFTILTKFSIILYQSCLWILQEKIWAAHQQISSQRESLSVLRDPYFWIFLLECKFLFHYFYRNFHNFISQLSMNISGRGSELPINRSQVSERASQFCVFPIFEYFCWNENFCFIIFIEFFTILYQSYILWILQEEDLSCPSTDRKSAREPLNFARSLYLNIFVGMKIFVSLFL
jgi:hypothetical protein